MISSISRLSFIGNKNIDTQQMVCNKLLKLHHLLLVPQQYKNYLYITENKQHEKNLGHRAGTY